MKNTIFKPHQLTKHTKLLQKAVILDEDNKALILQRRAESFYRPNCWDLPGGNSEWPQQVSSSKENLHFQDLQREIQEETSLKFSLQIIKQARMIHFSTYYDYPRKIYAIICGWKLFLNDLKQPSKVEISDEHQGYCWVNQQEINDYDFGGKKGEFVKSMILQAWKNQE